MQNTQNFSEAAPGEIKLHLLEKNPVLALPSMGEGSVSARKGNKKLSVLQSNH